MSYTVGGNPDPDCTGSYSEAGTFSGQPYYRRGTDNWYLWWCAGGAAENHWLLSDALGGTETSWIGPDGGAILGDYEPYSGASGTAVVTGSAGHLPDRYFKPIVEPTFPPFVPPPPLPIVALEPTTFTTPPIPSADHWYPPQPQPVLFGPAFPWGSGPGLIGNPDDFVPPPAITADRIYAHPQPPIWAPPWTPPADPFPFIDPSLFVTPNPITADRFYWPPPQPILLPPSPIYGWPFVEPGIAALGLDDTAPPVDGWCPQPQQPLFPRPGGLTDEIWARFNCGLFPTSPMIRHRGHLRGLYRVFNPAVYRFYRSNSAPPEEGDTPFATSSSLPHEPTDTYADGTWYLACSYFNGVLDSGFLPVGPNGERYLRLDLSSGAETGSPPPGPLDWRLESQGAGMIRVIGCVYQLGTDQGDEWAIAYTTNGSTPPADTPDVTVTMTVDGLQILEYDLPAQSHGTTVKVRLQTRRNDGTAGSPVWVYSEASTVQSIVVDASGPTAPIAGERWPGALPEEV